jgi:ankyrin repeat protein
MPDPGKEFIKAAKRGDLKALAVLLESNAELISARDSDGSTALHCATWKGHEAVVAWLLNAGADVRAHNENDHWGTLRYTPQHMPIRLASHGDSSMRVRT